MNQEKFKKEKVKDLNDFLKRTNLTKKKFQQIMSIGSWDTLDKYLKGKDNIPMHIFDKLSLFVYLEVKFGMEWLLKAFRELKILKDK